MVDLGSYLKNIRERGGCSLRDLAKRSGYSRSYISAIEKGKRTPNAFALKCIVKSMELQHADAERFMRQYVEFKAAC